MKSNMKKCRLILFVIVSGLFFSSCSVDKDIPKDISDNQEVTYTSDDGYPVVSAPITLSIFGEQHPNHASWDTMSMFKEYEKKTGIDINFEIVPSQGFAEKKSLLFAGGDLPDMFVRAHLSNEEIVKYGSSGVLIDLSPILSEHAPAYSERMVETPAIKTRITAPDGKIYSLSDVISLNAARTEKIWSNKSWLDELNIQAPKTIDELGVAMKVMKGIDFDKNGNVDEYPMGAASMGTIINNLIGSWGHQIQFDRQFDVINGRVKTWVDSKEYKELLMWVRDAYASGLIDPEVFTHDYAKYMAKMKGGKMGFFFNQADDAFGVGTMVGLPPFAGKSDKIYVKSQPVARGNGIFAITSECEYPDIALNWVDYFYSNEGSVFIRYGVEGENMYFDESGNPRYNDGILNSPEGSGSAIGKFTIWPGGGAPQWLNDVNSEAVASTTTVEAQSALDPFVLETVYPMPLFDEATTSRLAILQSDIELYINESAAKFIKRELSLEDDWETYISTLEKIGIKEWEQIYQKSVDTID
ncbi:MAG: extracellular solute-binding protein [Lachnospirales bacterium]